MKSKNYSFFQNDINRKLIWLIIIYCCAHFLLLFISGQWWDDWCYMTQGGIEHLKTGYLESGIPLQAYNILSVMWLPNWGYRIVVFFLFLAIGLLFFLILRSLDFITDEDAFWISAVAMLVPVNDARVVLNCYGYSICLTTFMLGFFVITKMVNCTGKKRIILRIISYVCLLHSYTTESLLVFTGIIWIYLFYISYLKSKGEKPRNKVLLFFKSNWDYLVLPFLYYIFKQIYFKPYGAYAGYNTITIDLLIENTLGSPLTAINTFIRICMTYKYQIDIISIIVLFLFIILYLIIQKKKNSVEEIKKIQIKKHILFFVLGVIVYYAGLFAYIVIRGNSLLNEGVDGRDSMLAGFGIAIMFVAASRCIPIKKCLQNLIPIFFIVLGTFYFNNAYLNYQEDWYHQQQFANSIEQYHGFNNDNTILCDFSDSSPINGTRFYSLNGNSYIQTGKMDKFYFCSINDLSIGLNFNNAFLNGYNADEYDPSDMTIDGVLIINNPPISNKEILRIRFDELFLPEVYEQDIKKLSDIQYIRISKEFSNRLYDLYTSKTLTSSILRKELSEYYTN